MSYLINKLFKCINSDKIVPNVIQSPGLVVAHLLDSWTDLGLDLSGKLVCHKIGINLYQKFSSTKM